MKIIDIVAPSSGKESPTQQIKEFVKKLGYEARVPANMIIENADPFSTNTDEERYNQLVAALQAPDSKIVWAFRGGYGATRLLAMLDAHDFSKPKKLLVGFSDITALFLYFYKRYNWPYIHGRSVNQLIENKVSEDEITCLEQALAGNWQNLKYELKPVNNEARDTAEVKGEIIGGNLCLIQCSLGTNWAIDARDKILFIEDVGERGYRIHRMLIHLLQAGVFDDVRALIIGDIMCQAEPDSGKYLCEDAIALFVRELNIPVFKSDDFGHGSKNYPLILGVSATISLDNGVACLSYA